MSQILFSRIFGLFWNFLVHLKFAELGLWILGCKNFIFLWTVSSSLLYPIFFIYYVFKDLWIFLDFVCFTRFDVLGLSILGYLDFVFLTSEIKNLDCQQRINSVSCSYLLSFQCLGQNSLKLDQNYTAVLPKKIYFM